MEKTKIFIIDVSGSMNSPFNQDRTHRRGKQSSTLFSEINHKFEAAKTYLLRAVINLANQSQYSQVLIISFAQTSSIVYQGDVANLNQIKQVINSLTPNGGGTNLASAFQLVINFLSSTNTPVIRSLDVITDGLVNKGEDPKIPANILLANFGVRFYFYLINNTDEGYKVALKIVKDDDDGKIEIIDSSQKLLDSSKENESVEEKAASAIAATNQIYNSQLARFNSKNQGIERTKFTLIYPEIVIARRWYSLDLLIYVDSLSKTIKNICSKLIKKRGLIEETEYNDIAMTCTNIIPEGSEITVKINSEHISVNPEYISLKWHEPYYNFSFRICCSEHQIDDCDVYINYGDISVDVYIDNLPVLSIPLSLQVIHDNDELNDTIKDTKYDFLDFQWVEQIFASYAPEDEQLVKILKEQYEVIGINMLTDLKQYHQALEWGKRELSNKIEQSDIFQLFWSSFAQADKNVETEYQQALNLIKNQKKNQNFITPLYWEEPIPSIPSKLSNFYFYRLRLLTTEQTGNELDREREHNRTLSEIAKIQASNAPIQLEVNAMSSSNQNNPHIKIEKSNIASFHGEGKINTAIIEQYNFPPEVKQNLVEAAKEIQDLLDNLAITYSPPSPTNNLKIATETVEAIENKPVLKARIISTLKAGGMEAFKELINHPALNILMASIEGWNSVE
ncbi:MAG: VWA domain-containing protein [Planktothrix sp.]